MVIYIPALSVGATALSLLKNTDFRFYNKDESSFYHPYILFSAGHLMDVPDFAQKMGFNFSKGIYFGDSGGFQIAVKKLENTEENRRKIFEFLENNTNISANLDIPPYVSSLKGSSDSVFDESLQLSYNNFKYFDEYRSGKTKYLNVLHGRNIGNWNKWYDKVKGFEFDGWAIGSIGADPSLSLQALFFLYMKGEMGKKSNKLFHLFGTSKPNMFIYLVYFCSLLERLKGIKIILTSDSSSPSKNSAFGGYYISHDFESFKCISYTNKFRIKEGETPNFSIKAKLPCTCDVCKNLTTNDIFVWNSRAYAHLTLHNILFFKNYIEIVKRIIDTNNDELIYNLFPNSIVKNLKVIRQAFDVKNPVEQIQISGTRFSDNTKVANSGEFFDYDSRTPEEHIIEETPDNTKVANSGEFFE